MKYLRFVHSQKINYSLNKYNVIGLMSGTSLDGLDIAFCNFLLEKNIWKYKILAAKTFSYDKEWKQKLSSIENKNAEELALLHSEYGHFVGKIVKKFMREFSPLSFGEGQGVRLDFVSSHGHTIFHQPFLKSRQSAVAVGKKKRKTHFTFQLGNGAAIATECGLPLVCDFRTTDVALGGQGAPLVPIGDKLLFSDYDFCLNIGGIANISFHRKDTKAQRIFAFDICPANIVLNHLANKSGKDYDKDGAIAKSGKINEKLLNELNGLLYYSLEPPKSLGKERILKEFFLVLNKHKISVEDKMRTVVEHIAVQISLQFENFYSLQFNQQPATRNQKLLVTGGGAHNKFLMERIRFYCQLPTINYQLIIPDKLTVDFKEALIFAFLGVLRMRNEVNCLASVTGAKKDSCG